MCTSVEYARGAASAEQEARKQTIAKLKEEAGGAPLIHTSLRHLNIHLNSHVHLNLVH